MFVLKLLAVSLQQSSSFRESGFRSSLELRDYYRSRLHIAHGSGSQRGTATPAKVFVQLSIR